MKQFNSFNFSGTYVVSALATEENIKLRTRNVSISLLPISYSFDITVGSLVGTNLVPWWRIFIIKWHRFWLPCKNGAIQRFDEDGNLTGGT